MSRTKKYTWAGLLIAVATCGVYVHHKDTYFDRIVGNRPARELSYHKGFSIYRELIYPGNPADPALFNKVVERYESDPGNQRCNFKKQIIHANPMMVGFNKMRSLPFHEYSQEQIQEQVSFVTEDFREGTDLCNGGAFIVIRVYSLR